MANESVDAVTQRIPRPETQPTQAVPRLPAGLDPARSSDTSRVDDSTNVLSLDELMTLAAEPRRRPAPPASVAPSSPPEAQRGATHAAVARSWGPPMRRMGATWVTLSRNWLETDDNALIAATALITMLLVVIIATL